MRKRSKAHPKLELPLWKRDGSMYFVDPPELQIAIRNSQNSDEVIRKRMGYGYRHIEEALQGKRIDEWAASHIEWGLKN